MGMWDGGLLEESWGAEVDDVFEVFDTMEIPLLGIVAAGEPYRAFGLDDTLSVPTTLWAGKQVFALRVKGSSMIDEGIHHGDYVIIEPRQIAENGQTVIAEIDGGVTVKKYFREADGSIRLQPANPEMLPLVVRGNNIRIIGVVVGIMRKFGPQRAGHAPAAAPRLPDVDRDIAPNPVSAPIAAPHPPTPRGTAQAGDASQPPRATAPRHATARPKRSLPQDNVSLDLAVNAIESQLVRWQAAMEHAAQDKQLKKHLPQMSELGRDLQALRDWCGRTSKPGLRRALLIEANRIMRRMQRFAAITPVQLPDLVLH